MRVPIYFKQYSGTFADLRNYNAAWSELHDHSYDVYNLGGGKYEFLIEDEDLFALLLRDANVAWAVDRYHYED